MNEESVFTLGEYLSRTEELPRKVFQSGEHVYTVLDVWQEIASRDIFARMKDCSLEENGRVDVSEINLSRAVYLHDAEELVEGVNANRTFPYVEII